jgi:hypothetical protein
MKTKKPSGGKTYYHGFDPLPSPPGGIDKTDHGAYLPTEAEIESACQRIQAGWDFDDCRLRPYEQPTVSWRDLATV